MSASNRANSDELTNVADQILMILDSSKSLTKESVITWFNEFLKLSNNNLNISKKRFIEFYKKFLPRNGDPEKFCDLVFKAFDSHHTGNIGAYVYHGVNLLVLNAT
jgi:hypothetical protein